jgi:DNA-binding transcriptional LysR family regulator
MSITLKQLEAYHAVMSLGSVTRASRQLGVSQPAISRIIADFEESAGFPLFTRASRNLVPTARGRALHAEVARTYLGLGHIENSMQILRDRGEGQLRLGVVPSLLSHVSHHLVAPFMRVYPQASISLEVVATLNALDWASFRQTDIGITFEAISGSGIETSVIGQTEAACVVPSGHWLALAGKTVHARDLTGEIFISYMPDSGFRTEVDRIFSLEGIQRDLRIEARTTAAVCELAAALGGATIVPSPGPQLAADTRLAILPFRPRLVSDVVLVQPSGGVHSPLASAFAAHAIMRNIDFLADFTSTDRSAPGKSGLFRPEY